MKSCVLLLSLFFLLPRPARAEAPKQPLSAGASTIPIETPEEATDFSIRIGNESNTPDGVFGPFTYGLRANHTFEGGASLEAGYMRLHERNTSILVSSVDEAQITYKLPERVAFSQHYILDGTLWVNRMIDMYTNVVGAELTWKMPVSFTLGYYLGTAAREELTRHFQGVQVGASSTFGPLDVAIAHLNGRIGNGYYRKSALELGTEAFKDQRYPATFTMSVEDRFFDFGNGGPLSAVNDEWILILSIELHLVH